MTNGIHVKIGVDEPVSNSDFGLTKYFSSVDCLPIRATTTHEVGHALSLTHTYGDSDIMRQGVKNYWQLSETDINFLIGKWGE